MAWFQRNTTLALSPGSGCQNDVEQNVVICKISHKTVATKGSSTHLFHNLKFILSTKQRTPQTLHFHVSSTPQRKTLQKQITQKSPKWKEIMAAVAKCITKDMTAAVLWKTRFHPIVNYCRKSRTEDGVEASLSDQGTAGSTASVSRSTKSLRIRVAKKEKPLDFSSKRQQCPLPHHHSQG